MAESKKTGKLKDLSFEEALEALDSKVAAMEQESLPLDALVSAYREGHELLKHCEEALKKAEVALRVCQSETLAEAKVEETKDRPPQSPTLSPDTHDRLL